MTRQQPDTITLEGGEYVLCEHVGGPLFDPREHGARIVAVSSACPHGFVCGYGVSASALHLTSMATWLDEVPELPMLGPPTSRRPRPPYTHVWTNLAVPIPFTGSLLAGRSSKRDRAWFPTALRCEQVLELVLEQGRVCSLVDVSEFFVRLREAYRAIDRGRADAEVLVRSTIATPTGLTGAYGFTEHLRNAWERDVRVRTNEAHAKAQAAAHRALPKRDPSSVILASRPWLDGRKDGAWVEGTCPRCGQEAKLRVCVDRAIVVCYPCYWEL